MTSGSKQSSTSSLGDWLSARLLDLEDDDRRRQRLVTKTGPGWCEREGCRLLNFASNDYLGLCHDERVCETFAKVAAKSSGSGASALVTGRSEWHERLEATIAAFEGTQAALVFPSGYAANVGTLSSLIGPDDVVFGDRLNHASLIDGCRLSGAQFRVYRHDELGKLEARLERQVSGRALAPGKTVPPGARTFIVTDAVFSMDGTVAPLIELCEIAKRHDAILIVDEAHGTGVLGDDGRGACEALGVEDQVAVRIGTLSKAVGTLGGFVAGSRELVDYLWNSARSQFFSTALPPAVCAAAIAAFDVLSEEPERRDRMQSNARLLRHLLRSQHQVPSPPENVDPSETNSQSEERGLSEGAPAGCELSDGVPIVPVVVGSDRAAVAAAKQIEQDGFLVACVRPPTVPNGTARLRISVSSIHTEDDIRRLAESVRSAVASVQEENQ